MEEGLDREVSGGVAVLGQKLMQIITDMVVDVGFS